MTIRFSCLLALLLSAPLAAQSWQSAAPLATPRAGAAAAVLDGRLYVIGGRGAGGVLLRTAEVFDPATGWSPVAALEHPRADARAVVLDGRIYLIGGQDDEGTSNDTDVYNPATNEWRTDDNLRDDRDGTAAGVVGGRLYVIGGASASGSFLSSCEEYADGDWERYPTWTLTPARALAGSASLGGAIVVAGGFSQAGPLATVQRFVPGTAPASLPALPTARGGLTLVATGGDLIAIGGRDAGDARLTSVDRLAAGALAWTAVTPLPEAREAAVAAVLGADLYVVGGTGLFGSVLASMVRLPGAGVAGENGPDAVRAPALTLDGPNPARGNVRLRLETTELGLIRLAVVDVQGREVAVLADGAVPAGQHRLVWAAGSAPAGVYAARLTTAGGSSSLRFTVVR